MNETVRRFMTGARQLQAEAAAIGLAAVPVVWQRPAWGPEDATWVKVELGHAGELTIVVEFDDQVAHRIDVESAEQLAQRILEAVAAARGGGLAHD